MKIPLPVHLIVRCEDNLSKEALCAIANVLAAGNALPDGLVPMSVEVGRPDGTICLGRIPKGERMSCRCGRDLGYATVDTKGVCRKCGSSIWLQVARRVRPDADAIAAQLQAENASACEHGRNPCYSQCSVERVENGWRVIPEERRQDWFDVVTSPRPVPDEESPALVIGDTYITRSPDTNLWCVQSKDSPLKVRTSLAEALIRALVEEYPDEWEAEINTVTAALVKVR